MNMFVTGQGAEFLDARFYVVAADALTGINRFKIHIIRHRLICLDHSFRNLNAQLLLRFQYGNPELSFRHNPPKELSVSYSGR